MVVKLVQKRRKVMVIVMMADDYGDGEDNDSNDVVYIRMRVTATVRMIMTC